MPYRHYVLHGEKDDDRKTHREKTDFVLGYAHRHVRGLYCNIAGMIDIGAAIAAFVWLIEAAWFAVLYIHTNRSDADEHE